MPRPSAADALYLCWQLPHAGSVLARQAHRRLSLGESRNLYRLRSWVIVGREVRALLAPEASLERIANAMWGQNPNPVATRWIQPKDCARVTRDIETAPVALGLAARPEQWPYSSAACK